MYFRVNRKQDTGIEMTGWGWINTERWQRKRWRLSTGLGVKENPLLFSFFFLQDCLALVYVRAFCWAIGVREGDWDRERGEARGNRCSALLGWMHTGEGDRERIPHFSSTILQQCRDIYNNGSLALSALCYWSCSGNPIHTVNLIVVLTTHLIDACVCFTNYTVILSVSVPISQVNVIIPTNWIWYIILQVTHW